LIKAATFDILYTDSWFPAFFRFGDFESFNKKFEESNMETMNMIMNLGTLFIVFSVLIARYFLLAILKVIELCVPKLRRWTEAEKKKIFWGKLIEYIGPAYIELAFGTILNL